MQCLQASERRSDGQVYACRDISYWVSSEGAIFSSGDATDCRLGYLSSSNAWHPTRMPSLEGLRVRHAAAGPRHTVLCTKGGAVFTFGQDQSGSCGVGLEGQLVSHPTRVEGLSAIQVAAGFDFTLALGTKGQLFTFGSNREGCLGCGPGGNVGQPQPVSTLASVQVSRPTPLPRHLALFCPFYSCASHPIHSRFATSALGSCTPSQ